MVKDNYIVLFAFAVSMFVANARAEYTDDCITFSSEFAFTLKADSPGWGGVLWTSSDKADWKEWHGGTVSAEQAGGCGAFNLYVRGNADNTVIAGEWSKRWCLTGTTWIYCSGNIETLRGATDNANAPTTKGDYCYAHLFSGCTLLRSAPLLPAKSVSQYCYSNMFRGTSLTEAPALPATNLGDYCYHYMFADCGFLTNAPALPATTLARGCYGSMFYHCTALTDAPVLPAIMTAVSCYDHMFWDCVSLTNAPALPATTVKSCCYSSMFEGCGSLTDVPALPASTLASGCYEKMFYGCTSLEVNATGPGKEWKILATTTVDGWGSEMFSGTAGALQGDPELNTVYYIAGVPLSDGGPYKEEVEEIEWTFGVRDGAAFLGYGWQCQAIADSVTGSVEIPNQLGGRDVVSLAVGAFFKKSNITYVSLPSTVTNLEEAAFEHCSGLLGVSLPDGLLSVGDFGFHGCEKMETLSLPDSVTSIGESAFQGCAKLVISRFPQQLTFIGSYAFKACGSLQKLTVPSSVGSIGQNAFLDCNSLHSIDFEGAPPEGVGAAAIKADATICYNVEHKAEWLPVIAACGWTNAKPYVPGRTEHPNPACPRYTLLYDACGGEPQWYKTEVCAGDPVGTLPKAGRDRYEFIGWYTLPIGGAPIYAETIITTSLTAYAHWREAPEPINWSIPWSTWTDTSGYEWTYRFATNENAAILYNMGSTVVSPKPYGSMTIPSVLAGKPVKRIGKSSFYGFTGITSVVFPDAVQIIGGSAFRLTGLGSVKIPNTVKIIGERAFSGCQKLTSVEIPANVSLIGTGAFSICQKLLSISVDENNKYYASVSGLLLSKEGDALVSVPAGKAQVEIPSSVLSIADSSFEGCCCLSTVEIPQGVRDIGASAFSDCSKLVSVTVPSSVASIGEDAFLYCRSLAVVHVDSGDIERVRSLYNWPVGVEFLEPDTLRIDGDDGATVIGNSDSGYVIKPSGDMTSVVLSIPSGIEASKVTVEVAPNVLTVTPNGAAVKVVNAGYDITEHLSIPAADANGVIDLSKAIVKAEIVSETLDAEKGAVVELNIENPTLTTSNTRVGLVYTLREGATLGQLTAGDSKVGDGLPWTPTLTVKGGASAFYAISVGKQ